MRPKFRRSVLIAVMASSLCATSLSTQNAAADQTPGTRPSTAARMAAASGVPEGLLVAVNERGKISRSLTGVVSDGDVEFASLTKPAGATVRAAYLGTATTGFTEYQMTTPLRLADQDVPITGEIPNGIYSYNYLADVTPLVKATLDAAGPGSVSVPYQEPVDAYYIDGSELIVIWDDPNVTTDQSVTVLYGALKTSGDTYSVHLASPVHPAATDTKLEMSLGISYSYQSYGVQQYSQVDVNGQRMTTSAGGEDDGRPYNGALITVGGEGDSSANPVSPDATPTEPRSDDELYDLRPYVKDGDTDIVVTTMNPSADDNVFLATFAMNPPATIQTGEAFVYVAMGDSYQSGEGAAVDLRPSSNYLNNGYENGQNFAETVGAQENTYTADFLSTGAGNACHRALLNYAKINRDKFAPGQPVVLIDRTCSGAKVTAGDKPPIVGPDGSTVASNSQVQQALDRLQGAGLTAADVDLVTVGMGGNDARFGDILTACVGPALLEGLLSRYPNAPAEINWIVQQATCQRVDGWGVHTGDALGTLTALEQNAENSIRGAFSNARIMQLDYPDILPSGSPPAWCGGLRGKDVAYAKQRIIDIDDRIRTAASATGTELVDLQSAFYPNALCPSSSADRLANGIDQTNFNAEVTRLLNLDGTGDAVARNKLDVLTAAYRDARNCYLKNLIPFNSCDTSAANDRVMNAAKDLMAYLQTQEKTIFSNIMSRPGTTDDSNLVGFDRSRGLFHPNQAGFSKIACIVLKQYRGGGDCGPASQSAPTPPAGGNGIPLVATFGQLLQIIVDHFRANSPVTITLFSEPINLGTVQADATGRVDTSITVPDLSPGIHRLVLSGEGADGVQLTQELLLDVAGRPTDSYTVYLTGFTTRPDVPAPNTPIETVHVTLNGMDIGTFQVDNFGGVLVTIPTVETLNRSELTIVATSDLTGHVATRSVWPITSRPGLWATDPSSAGVLIQGSRFVTNGLVHSESDLSVLGVRNSLTGGVEYAATMSAPGQGNTIAPAAVKITAGEGAPRVIDISAYRPGGAAALAAGAQYRAIPASSCVAGVWTPTNPAGITGVVYVPCAVDLTVAGTYNATIAAEGSIAVTAKGITVGRGASAPGQPALVSGASGTAISVIGANAIVRGQSAAAAGELLAKGSGAALNCGAVAKRIQVLGADSSANVSAWCVAS